MTATNTLSPCATKSRTRRATTLAAAVLMSSAAAALAQPTLTTLATFNGSNGWTPSGDLIADAAGNLYGTTGQGGNLSLNNGSGYGTVFQVSARGGSVTTLATFNSSNGASPQGSVIVDAAGNLYGTTYAGGNLSFDGGYGYGSVFEVPAGGSSVKTLATFNGSNGSGPCGGVIADAVGNLYGTTYSGTDASQYGTVFQVPAAGGAVKTLATFNLSNGAGPCGSLIADTIGNLYGTTEGGGANGCGTVFEVPAGGGSVKTLASFDDSSGRFPQAGLIADAAGNVYGTTSDGASGNRYGTVFEVVAGSGSVKTLATFNSSNGASPYAGLIADAAGNLYGTTNQGGDLSLFSGYGDGTVFEVPAGGGPLVTLATFNGSNGASPDGGLIADAAGNLYGTTELNGGGAYGTVFELSGTGFVVPEPSTGLLILIPALGALLQRRQRTLAVFHVS